MEESAEGLPGEPAMRESIRTLVFKLQKFCKQISGQVKRRARRGKVGWWRGGEEMRWKCEKYLRGGSICRIILVILQVKII